MNYDFKTFINFCMLNSTVFIVLISAESLFGFNNSFSAMIKASEISDAIFFMCNFASMSSLLIFFINMLKKNVRDLYFEGRLSFYELLDPSIPLILNHINIKDLLMQNKITFNTLIKIDKLNRWKLENDNIKDLFSQNKISFYQLNQLKQLDFEIIEAIKDSNIRDLLIHDKITLDELISFSNDAKLELRSFIFTNLITIIKDDNIKDLLMQNKILIDQLYLQCKYNFRVLQELCNHENIRDLFINNHLSLGQLNELNRNAKSVLKNDDIKNLFILNRITFHQLLVLSEADLLALQLQLINQSQNTHTTSVHQSASDSAIALKNRYGHNISNNEVTTQINGLISAINHLNPNQTITTHIYEAAKRGLERLANINTYFIDPVSELSIIQLIGLTFMAGKDDNYRQHTFNHYLEAMVLALYEIQRGDNFDNVNDIDDMRDYDEYICPGGTFNKIIEKMVGILPDCYILFITFKTIRFKANKLVKNIISQFFDDRASLNLPNEEELSSLEITQRETYIGHLRNILDDESNHEENPLFKALNTKLLQHIKYNLDNEFSPHHKEHFNEYFSIETFIDTILTSESIQTFINNEIDRYIEEHQTDTNLIQHTLFQSSEPTSSESDHALTQNSQDHK